MATNYYLDETPDDVKNAKGIHLITQNTPNGKKVQIFLEELKDVYGTEWTTTLINIMTNVQKRDWFIKLNPNGRIPVLIDNTKSTPFPVHETSAELFYLQKEIDKNDVFWFKDELEQSEATQWSFFWHGSGQPIQGQLGWFSRQSERNEMALTRFKNEVLRVFGVLEIRLSGKFADAPRDYLVGKDGGKYSVADITTWPWVNGWKASNQISDAEIQEFPHLLKWIARIAERPAVQRGIGKAYQQ